MVFIPLQFREYWVKSQEPNIWVSRPGRMGSQKSHMAFVWAGSYRSLCPAPHHCPDPTTDIQTHITLQKAFSAHLCVYTTSHTHTHTPHHTCTYTKKHTYTYTTQTNTLPSAHKCTQNTPQTYIYPTTYIQGFPHSSVGKNLPSVQETWVRLFGSWVGKIPWKRKWQPTPVFLPGESHGQRSLAGYSPWGHKSQTRPSD